MRWQLKDMLNRELGKGRQELSGRAAALDLGIPALAGGRYFLNLWLDSAAGWKHYLRPVSRKGCGIA